MGDRKIPNAVIAVVADVLSKHHFNHTRLNTLFASAGAPGEPPDGNCTQKCDRWLKACNSDRSTDAFSVLGSVLKDFMEQEEPPRPWDRHPKPTEQERVRDILAKHSLSYCTGGQILGAGSSPASK